MRGDMSARLAHRIALVLWPSFVVGGIGTVCFFSLFDPATLPFSDSLLPFDEGSLGQHRMLVYSVGFFIFWMFAAASSWLTSFLQRSPFEINDTGSGTSTAPQTSTPGEPDPGQTGSSGTASNRG